MAGARPVCHSVSLGRPKQRPRCGVDRLKAQLRSLAAHCELMCASLISCGFVDCAYHSTSIFSGFCCLSHSSQHVTAFFRSC